MKTKIYKILILLVILSITLPLSATAKTEQAPPVPVTFTILHTNDFHGQLEPSGSNPGMARVADVINDIRTTQGTDNVLVVDAGDEMQGSLLSNLQQGLPVIATYNAMSYAAATFGNHEFDWGQAILTDRTTQATYPYVTARTTCSSATRTSSRASRRFVNLRERQGLRVRVVDVQDIYDEFSGGLLDPRAIRDFIAYTYDYWPRPAPAYVLLVGDGTYDFMDREGQGGRTFIPPLLANVDPLLGETAADNRFVTVAGNDVLPDLHLGRLPVNTVEELGAMVSKIIAYEETPAPGEWRDRVVFVADNQDAAGSFAALSDEAAAYVPPEMPVQRINLGSGEYPTGQALRGGNRQRWRHSTLGRCSSTTSVTARSATGPQSCSSASPPSLRSTTALVTPSCWP